MDKESFYGFLLIGAFLIFWNYDLNPFKSGITINVQEYECENEGEKNCQWKNLKQMIFYMPEGNDSVIKIWDSIGDSFFELDDCIIVDNENWSCEYLSIGGLKDGEPIKQHFGRSPEKVRIVGNINWWLKS